MTVKGKYIFVVWCAVVLLTSCRLKEDQKDPFSKLFQTDDQYSHALHTHQMGKKHLNIVSFGPMEGLFAKSVQCSAVDSSGLLWLGTENGIFSYDGKSFVNYTNSTDVINPIEEREIREIEIAPNGDIVLMAGSGNIVSIDRETLGHHYLFKPHKPLGVAQWFNFEIDRDYLWVYGMEGPISMEGKLLFPEVFDSMRINYAIVGYGHEVLLDITDLKSKTRGFYRFHREGPTLEKFFNDEEDAQRVRKEMLTDHTYGGYPYIFVSGQKGSVFRLNQQSGEMTMITCGEKNLSEIWGTKKSIHFNKEARILWVGCWAGTLLQVEFDEQGNCVDYFSFKKHLYDQNNFTNGPILSITEDGFDNIWVGTYLDGWYKLSRKNGGIELLSKKNGLLSDVLEDNITAMYQEDSTLYFGTQHGLYQYDLHRNTTRNIPIPKSAEGGNQWVTRIISDIQKGNLLVSTYGSGIFYYSGIDSSLIDLESAGFSTNLSKGASLFCNDMVKRGHFVHTAIYGSTEVSIDLEKRAVFSFSPARKGLSGDQARAVGALNTSVAIDHNGRIWRSNVDRYTITCIDHSMDYNFDQTHPESFAELYGIKEYCLSDNNGVCTTVSVVFVLRSGEIVAGTQRGLMKYQESSDQFVSVEIPQMPKEIYVQSMMQDGQGRIWVGTMDGIYVLDSTLSQRLDEYNIDNGFDLQNRQFNKNANCLGSEGRIFFGGVNGMNIFPQQKPKELDRQPKVEFSSLKMSDGKKIQIHEGEKIKVPQRQFPVHIEIFASDLTKPEYIRYAYMVKGIDDDITENVGDHTLSLSHLPEGKFSILATAKGVNSRWSKDIAKMTIQVIPVWYKRSAFTYLMGTLILFAILFYYRAYLKRKEVEKDNNLKLRLLKIQTLQSQMNPHFIFNVLGRIQNLILSGDAKLANQHLIKLSKLMRGFLDASVVSNSLDAEGGEGFIPLHKEIELLSMYVEFEHLKYKNEFDYEITVDKDIDVYAQEIPGMILQPFVENAIKHGLLYKEEKGLLHIHFQKTNSGFKVSIKDNGVGRARARQIQSDSIKSYKSRGTDLIKERILLMNEVGYDIRTETRDDPKGGTIVLVWIDDV